MGRFKMGTMGLGKVQVRGLSLVPSPPAMITAFTYPSPPFRKITGELVALIKLFVFVGL